MRKKGCDLTSKYNEKFRFKLELRNSLFWKHTFQ